MRLLLEAEAATLSGKKRDCEDVRKMFNNAISAALRSGLTNFAAIANERAGEYMLEANDEFWGQAFIKDAWDCYARWGALAKVAHLEKMYNFLQGNNSSCGSTAHLRGVERVSTIQIRGVPELVRESGRSMHRSEDG